MCAIYNASVREGFVTFVLSRWKEANVVRLVPVRKYGSAPFRLIPIPNPNPWRMGIRRNGIRRNRKTPKVQPPKAVKVDLRPISQLHSPRCWSRSLGRGFWNVWAAASITGSTALSDNAPRRTLWSTCCITGTPPLTRASQCARSSSTSPRHV